MSMESAPTRVDESITLANAITDLFGHPEESNASVYANLESNVAEVIYPGMKIEAIELLRDVDLELSAYKRRYRDFSRTDKVTVNTMKRSLAHLANEMNVVLKRKHNSLESEPFTKIIRGIRRCAETGWTLESWKKVVESLVQQKIEENYPKSLTLVDSLVRGIDNSVESLPSTQKLLLTLCDSYESSLVAPENSHASS